MGKSKELSGYVRADLRGIVPGQPDGPGRTICAVVARADAKRARRRKMAKRSRQINRRRER